MCEHSFVTGYQAPKKRLHREFLYLNHDTVLNSLSALEAGKVDEIIQKVNEAREGGFEAGVKAGPVKGGGSRKKAAQIEEELVRTRTWFSAFDAWHNYLVQEEALGRFDEWSLEVRNAMTIGDTVEFTAELVLSPVHKLMRTFLAFANSASHPDSVFAMKGPELAETKKTARMMSGWLGKPGAPQHLPVYLRPGGVEAPKILAALQDPYIIGNREELEGTFTVVGQVSALLNDEQVESIIRVIRDVPPTPSEVAVISEAIAHFIEPAQGLGVDLGPDDINIPAPAVVMRPVAIFQ